jgi:hypothetical protein
MKKLFLCASIALLAIPAVAHSALPKDVERFIAQREGCDHFRGELPEPGEKSRMKEVNSEIRRLCKGTDKALASLKKKYANDATVMKSLDEFEPQIEASSAKQPRKATGAR